MTLEQELRDVLHRDAAVLTPVAPGPDDARQRAFRRKRRMQSGVVMLSAVALAGATLAVVESRPSGDTAQVQSQPSAPGADLAWRTVAGTVSMGAPRFTSADGVTYALSTAPGSTTTADAPPQELYATRDGVTWTHASLGAKPWVAGLAESNGVLYAVGTGPGAQAGSVDYKLSTSSDGGSQWDDTAVPVEFTKLSAGVKATSSVRTLVARGAHSTVVIANQSYYVNVASVLGQTTNYNETATGVQILDMGNCKLDKRAAQAAANPAEKPGKAPVACTPKVASTRPWSDFGVTDPSTLHQERALVRPDGGTWQPVTVPVGADSTLLGVTATSHGFLMSEQGSGAPTNVAVVKLLSSTDGRTWSPLASAVPRFDQVAISGDRIVGTDSATNSLYVSSDAGATWIPSQNLAGLLAAGARIQPDGVSADAGPLGFAALVRVDGANHSVHSFLINSSDGATWKVSDLNALGMPTDASTYGGVTVGADHLDVSYSVPNGTDADGNFVSKLVSLIATPKP